MDILAALQENPRPSGVLRCKLGRWLDEIPDDTPGKDALVATLTTTDPKAEDYRPTDRLDALLIQLGLNTSGKTIGDHRAGRCRCSM